MAPDTVQNIFFTIYFIFLHNFAAIFYSLGIIVGIVLSLWKPSRPYILIMLGFIILLFSFEYSKHIVEPLKEQTTNSLVTMRESPRIERVVHIVVARLVPLALPLLGWIMVLGGIGLHIKASYIRKNLE